MLPRQHLLPIPASHSYLIRSSDGLVVATLLLCQVGSFKLGVAVETSIESRGNAHEDRTWWFLA